MKEKIIANRPILLDGRLYKTGEELPDSGRKDSWLKAGDAHLEIPDKAPELKGTKKGGKEEGNDLQGDRSK